MHDDVLLAGIAGCAGDGPAPEPRETAERPVRIGWCCDGGWRYEVEVGQGVGGCANLLYTTSGRCCMGGAGDTGCGRGAACSSIGIWRGGVLWFQPDRVLRGWRDASKLCDIGWLGLGGWRLPTGRELASVLALGVHDRLRWRQPYFWTSTVGGNGAHCLVSGNDGDVYINEDDLDLHGVILLWRSDAARRGWRIVAARNE